jgi:hypothetical protein
MIFTRLIKQFPWILAVLAAGCGGNLRMAGVQPQGTSFIPDTTLNLSPSTQIPLERVVTWGLYAGVAYLVLDPFNPNWDIEEAAFPENHYHFSLKMKRFYAGGAGEARVVFNQRAKELMRRGGFDGYTIVEYNEGLESSVLGSQRVTQGVIRLTRKAA